jgi:uncharacterized protein DUF5681
MKGDRDGDYSVGYGRPPRHMQYQKGQSGNPRGRPKRVYGLNANTLNAALMKALAERVMGVENGRPRRMTKLEALVTQLANKAASGNLTAAKLFATFVQMADKRVRRLINEVTVEDLDALIAHLEGECAGKGQAVKQAGPRNIQT